MTLYWCAQR